VHISDGVLSAPVWIGGYVITAAVAAATSRKINTQDIPRMAVMTSVFFVASLVHIPIGPASVHLLLNGLVGIILGEAAFVSVLLGLILQALLFQHGGLTAIGANTLTMGLPALLAYRIFNLRLRLRFKYNEIIFAGIAAGAAVLSGIFILAALLVTTGSEFIGAAKYIALAHLPVMIVEVFIAGFVISFLMKVKPEILK
jgi:cobalt/nickel transport system permease protein